jgi:hypothetical protein
MTNDKFLTIRRFNQTCVFELSWGKGQQLCATVPYPESLSTFYQEWQRIYLSYYQSALRGWIEGSGSLSTPPIDWHTKLVQAEAKLLSEFHHWLRRAELFEIRAEIAKFYQQTPLPSDNQPPPINLFLTCHSVDLERLPWEAWEIGAEWSTSDRIRLARTPVTIRQAAGTNSQSRRKKVRVLVILGDDTGLNFQGDRAAVQSLSRIADIEFMGWQPGQDIGELKLQISAAIADKQGWDVLLFAGHSNETPLTGGELGIAPNASISIRDIIPQLLLAKERGLQFALFNSCQGLSLAHSLIDLGLSQVAVMREPIHNDVAQVFLLRFLQALGQHQNVQECLIAACQVLKLEKNLTYPSAYLIPSLFCHAEAELFRIPPSGIKQQLKQLLPTSKEAIALSLLTVLSLSLPIQDWLLERRVWVQGIYRQMTGQISITKPPPVLLVQIDETSIRQAAIADPKPMDRQYLAKLVDKLSQTDAKVVGIDYLLDRPHGEDDDSLAQSLQAAVQQKTPTTFVFASVRHETEGWLNVLPTIASPNWSLSGEIHLLFWYMKLVSPEGSASEKLPFAYVLALAHELNQVTESNSPSVITPQLTSKTELLSQIREDFKNRNGRDYRGLFSARSQRQSITGFSYQFGQMWFHPIIDFSIPPAQVYQTIPAWELLEDSAMSPQLINVSQQVVMIAPGGYGEAGIKHEGEDLLPLPVGLGYWFEGRKTVTGGEIHAYLIHHYLNQRFVVPIPDLWMLVLAVVLGKGISSVTGLGLRVTPRNVKGKRWVVFVSGCAIYGGISLQLYITSAMLLPCLIPGAALGIYLLPISRK